MDRLSAALDALASEPAWCWDLLSSAGLGTLSALAAAAVLDRLVDEGFASFRPVAAYVVAAVWLLVASLTLLVTGLVEVGK